MASLNIGILTRNPNTLVVFEYDEFDVRVSGNSEDIFGTKIAAFNSSAESETLLNATAVVPLANISGILNIDVNTVHWITVNTQGTTFELYETPDLWSTFEVAKIFPSKKMRSFA
ncbi:hypothetical protein Fot_03289 [Forsythia ovata]|uniref:Uncharacterized protein n=1 Tax=Forsythia ovata TaxID=205694 RepID=A0ABD1XA61_9LAMI